MRYLKNLENWKNEQIERMPYSDRMGIRFSSFVFYIYFN